VSLIGVMGGQQAYRFSGDAFEVFENFFGSANHNLIALDGQGRQIELLEKIESDIHKEAITKRELTHCPDLEVICRCTLEEFYYGSTKTVCFSRKSLLGDGASRVSDPIAKEIEIKPGMKPGHQMRFVGEGDLISEKKRGDLIVTLS